MKNVIVGTAGHVDHGKTCLIKALTGTDTDRLKEEKKRGITIELGFANMPCEEDVQIGIVDVPGHEKFVKNMLAGIGGIDLVLFVVALDEGVMPQTKEHLAIIKSLEIKKGILVFTKRDMVDDEWAEMVVEDTRELMKGCFLEEADSICVSAYTGENIEELRKMIIDKVKDGGNRREEEELFRLPIDRVFTMEGFGTVITGTLQEGCVHVGDEVVVYPSGQKSKIRGIQNHNQAASVAYAGMRTAINLAGLKKEDISRGEVLTREEGIVRSDRMDCIVKLFDDTNRALKSHDHVHVSYGSAQALCKIILLEEEKLLAGQEGLAQLVFDEEVPMRHNDKFIIRFYSPIESFGGGRILEPEARKHKKMDENDMRALLALKNGELLEKIEAMVQNRSGKVCNALGIARALGCTVNELEVGLGKLKKNKKVVAINNSGYIHKLSWDRIAEIATEIVKEYHVTNPVAPGMEKQELKNKLGTRLHITEREQEDYLFELLKRGILEGTENLVILSGFESTYSGSLAKIRKTLETIYKNAGMEALATEEVLKGFKDKKEVKQIITNMLREGILVRVNPSVYIEKESWDRAVELLKEEIGRNPEGQITLAQYRDLLNTSRKYAVQLLEAFDQQRITKKVGDARTLVS